MPQSLGAVKKRLILGYIIILLFAQLGLPLFHLFFSLHLSMAQTSDTIFFSLWMVPLIGGFFSVYLPLRLFEADTSYPNKVVLSNIAGICLFYIIAMFALRQAYGYPSNEIIKIPFLGLSIGILQCLSSYMLTAKTIFPHIEKNSSKKISIYYKHLLFIISVVILSIIIVGGVAFNQLEQSVLARLQGAQADSITLRVLPYDEYETLGIYIKRPLFNILLAFLTALAIATFLSFQFSRLISLPLKELAHSAEAMSNGQMKKAKAITGDEFEDLFDAFNLMIEKVKHRESELMLRGQHLALVYTLAEALNQNKTTEELFNLTMEWLETAFGLEVGALRLLKNGYLKLVVSKGIEPDTVEKIEMVKLGESIAGLAALKDDAMVVEDISALRGRYAAIAKELGLEYLVSIPLRCRERLIGTMSVGTCLKRNISYDTVNILNSVSNLLGIAIQRSEEFDKIEREKFQWETAINSISDPISVHDKQGRIKSTNKAFLEYFGLKENEVLGKYCFEVFHGTNMPHPECPQMEVMITRKAANAKIETRNNKLISISVHPIFKTHGAVDGSIHIARDVTEITTLREQTHQADKLSALGRLASGIAHNVNNPLTYSLNYLFILKETAGDEKTKELIKKIEQGIGKSKDVLIRLLDFSRPSDGPIEIIDIKETVMETLTFLSAEINKKNLSVHTIFQEKTEVRATKKAVEEVLLNLITNSLDAEATEITIECYKDLKHVTIAVTDNGSGIDKEHIPRLFEPYFTTKPTGTGLGLYVSYNIIRSLNGNLWCSSQKGIGTRFFILLPCL